MDISTSQTDATMTIQVDRTIADGLLAALPSAISEYVAAYAHLVKTYDFVKGVYVNASNGLTIYTVYQGERRAVSDKIYEAYGQVIDRFPSMPIDFRLLNHNRLDTAPVPGNAYKVFPS